MPPHSSPSHPTISSKSTDFTGQSSSASADTRAESPESPAPVSVSPDRHRPALAWPVCHTEGPKPAVHGRAPAPWLTSVASTDVPQPASWCRTGRLHRPHLLSTASLSASLFRGPGHQHSLTGTGARTRPGRREEWVGAAGLRGQLSAQEPGALGSAMVAPEPGPVVGSRRPGPGTRSACFWGRI